MIYKENGEWNFCDYKVKYKDVGQELEKYALPSKQWWEKTINNHSHLELIEFIEFEPTQEQEGRLEKLNQLRIPEGFMSYCQNYIENGEFPEGISHVLRGLEIAEYEKEQGQELSEREIAEIEQGQEISEHEIRILELEGSLT